MKIRPIRIGPVFLFFGLLLGVAAFPAAAQNSISGIVFDENRRPVSDIYVELLDELERLIGSRETRNGFYSFQRLNKGIYYLRVRTDGTNFREQKIRIDLGDLNSIGGVDAKQQDVYLALDEKRSGQISAGRGVIFVQEVPAEAKEQLERGVRSRDKNNDAEAVGNLQTALRIFPDYFEALGILGEIYLRQKKYREAEDLFTRATKVNEKSFASFFNLAVAQNNLNRPEEAAANLQKANMIDPGSINAHLLLGIIQRKLKRFEEAEKTLLRAKTLSRNKEPDVNWQLAELFYFDLKKPHEAADELDSFLKNLSEDERKNNPQKIETVRKLIRQIRSETDRNT
jgi:tetratricopeptide (TPR) repeat protein